MHLKLMRQMQNPAVIDFDLKGAGPTIETPRRRPCQATALCLIDVSSIEGLKPLRNTPQLRQACMTAATSSREIACAILLDTFGRLLLQQRDDVPGIVHPGKIGLFGGHREANESYLQCVVREIQEEISCCVAAERFEHFTNYESVDPELNGDTVYGEFFVARELLAESLVITEGSLLIIKPDELAAIEPQLTPPARFALNAFLNSESGHSFIEKN